MPIAAAVIGIFAAILYMSISSVLIRLKIDDPLEATGVHFGGGLAGLVGAALFINKGVAHALYVWAREGDWQAVRFALLVSCFGDLGVVWSK